MSTVAITVCYETPDLILRAVSSVKNLYPDMPVFIVDGSKYASPCFEAVEELQQRFRGITVRHTLYNIGHGNGLQYAIEQTKSEYILTFDSDIKLLGGCLPQMKRLLTPGVLGCGMVVTVDAAGFCRPEGIPYLHPYFALLRRSEYNKVRPVKNHGAPFIDTMISAHKRRRKVIEFDLRSYVEHKWKGTRSIHKTWAKDL